MGVTQIPLPAYGASGPTGPPGATGPVSTVPGVTGVTGSTGVSGATGPAGASFITGGVSGILVTATSSVRYYNDTGRTLTIGAVRASVGTAPTGSSVIVDVNKNGTTIFTTQGNRPTIAASAVTSGKVTTMNVTSLADGDYLTVDVDQVGSTVAGANLTVQVEVA